MGGEPVDHLLEVLDIAHVGDRDVAVVAGHAVALDHLVRERAMSATIASLPGAGRVRITTPKPKPSRRGSTMARYPVITPVSSSRFRRSATAGDDSETRRPSSASESRASLLQLDDQAAVRLVQETTVGGRHFLRCFLRHVAHCTFASAMLFCSSPDILRRMRHRTPPPHAYFVVSAIFHYLGPAFAVLLFAHLDVLGVAWLRIASAAADLRRSGGGRGARVRDARPGRAAACCSAGARRWPR